MRKFIIIILLLPFLSLSQNYKNPKNHVSIGLFDHKTGFSAVGYSRSILQNNNNEIFIGCGSMIAINTFVMGYKKCLIKSFVDGYSVISFQKIYGMSGSSNAAFLSFGVEKKIWKVLFINTGINITSLVKDLEFLIFPTLNLNIRY